MIHTIIHFVNTVLIPLGPVGIFFGAMTGEVFSFIPPLSLILGAGYYLSHHAPITFPIFAKLLLLIVLPEALGATFGSFFTYAIGFFGGKPIIQRFGKYIGVSWAKIEKFHNHFIRHNSDSWLIFAFRAVPLVPHIVINTLCGLIQIPFSRYVVFTFLGMFVRATIYLIIGWSLGDAYRIFVRFLGGFEYNIGLLFVVAISLFVIWSLVSRKPWKRKSDTI